MLQWPLVNGTAESSSSSKGCSTGQREQETHLQVTRKIVLPSKAGRGGQPAILGTLSWYRLSQGQRTYPAFTPQAPACRSDPLQALPL